MVKPWVNLSPWEAYSGRLGSAGGVSISRAASQPAGLTLPKLSAYSRYSEDISCT